MNKIKKDFLELFIYGIAAAISGTLFFFGLMYPDYLYTREAYCITGDLDTQEVWGVTGEEFERLSEQDKLKLISRTDPAHVKYKSKLWEILH